MKNGLVSKILKLALVPAIALSLNTNKIHAQENLFECDIDIALEGGRQDYYHGDIIPYDDWEKNFQPPCNGQYLSLSKDTFSKADFNLALKIRLGDYFSIGPRFGFPISGSIQTITLHWWDPVTVKRLDLNEFPSVGISAGLDLFDHWVLLNSEYSRNSYNISETSFKGVDVYGGKNYSVPIDTQQLYKGSEDNFSASIFLGNPKDNLYFGIGFFAQTAGASYDKLDLSSYGVKFDLMYRIPFAKINPPQF